MEQTFARNISHGKFLKKAYGRSTVLRNLGPKTSLSRWENDDSKDDGFFDSDETLWWEDDELFEDDLDWLVSLSILDDGPGDMD
ncbi:hypothetical protein [Pseudobacteriovorax antillogorgiicola]|nr:hypothetical protein [Pseudobacteriovorax antillogorgiicola]